jgi:hypothetical protein
LASTQEATGRLRLSLLDASFSGGVYAYYAAKRAGEIDCLVLVNPQLDCKMRTLDSRPYWHEDHLGDEMAGQLTERGHIQFTPSLRHGYGIAILVPGRTPPR